MKKIIIITTIQLIIISILIVKIYNKKETIKNKESSININYYNKKYLKRYKKYKEKHKELSTSQIIKNVNMNLDKEFYKYNIPAKYLNTNKILVNKYYYLKKDYVPNNLEEVNLEYSRPNMILQKEAKYYFELLAKKAKEENLNIIAMSTYRSYQYQEKLYNTYKEKDGVLIADTYSGRPGHSEHQTGLSVDVYNGKEPYTNFENTEEFIWMNKHAYEYGFILRFPKDKEKETGYQYESWHYRYVGKRIAKYIKKHNITYEEYYATKIKDWKNQS